jgi:hypothetical protein
MYVVRLLCAVVVALTPRINCRGSSSNLKCNLHCHATGAGCRCCACWRLCLPGRRPAPSLLLSSAWSQSAGGQVCIAHGSRHLAASAVAAFTCQSIAKSSMQHYVRVVCSWRVAQPSSAACRCALGTQYALTICLYVCVCVCVFAVISCPPCPSSI